MKKQGIFLPLVLILLVVLLILGLFMNRSAQHEFRFAYRSADHLRATYVCQALIHTALAHIKENMNKPGDLRKAFVSDDKTSFPLFFVNLDAEYIAAFTAMQLKLNEKENNSVIDPCKIGLIPKLEVYLSESTKVNSQGTAYGDRIKRLIIKATIKYTSAGGTVRYAGGPGSFDKTMVQCFDVKVADVRPVGNRYVMMVAESQTEDYNDGSNHFRVSSKDHDKNVNSDGISINGDTEIKLYPQYFKHEEWKDAQKDEYADLATSGNDPNSDKSLPPGWDCKTSDIDKANGVSLSISNWVPDNEPHTNYITKPGMTCALTDLETTQPGNKRNQVGPDPHGKHDFSLISTGGGNFVEFPDACGPNGNCSVGITPFPFIHSESKTENFFNTGYPEKTTHLFWKNCSVPCPIFGQVKKRWNVIAYFWKAASNTSSCTPAGAVTPVCIRDIYGNLIIACGFHSLLADPVKWDQYDDSFMTINRPDTIGCYWINGCTWNGTAKEIAANFNFKSKSDFKESGDLVFLDFLKGATRRVIKINDDVTLYKSQDLWTEGIVEVAKPDDFKLEVQNPGCLVSSQEFTLSHSKYSDNSFFAQKTAISLVSNKTIKLTNTEMWAGICSRKIDASKINLHGNVVAQRIVTKDDPVGGDLKYDSVFQEMAIDQIQGGGIEKASFVVTISPIAQETFDWNNLK
ncbi:MAG: hypothetical protein PHQ23_13460 [Candidatus Wallbacteria bacterium]|nr:hypothetical protein [Candidatus Wallbacteria bacterium]